MTELRKTTSAELVAVPYDKLKIYTNLLGNPDDYESQGAGTIVKVGGRRMSDDGVNKNPDISWVDGNSQATFLLKRPIHRAALDGIKSSLSEHLNLATTGQSLGTDGFWFEGSSCTITEFNQSFPELQQPKPDDERLNRIFLINLFRRSSEGRDTKLVLFFRAEFSTENQQTYSEFFAELYNFLTFIFVDRRPEIAQFVVKYGLTGSPWPNRKL